MLTKLSQKEFGSFHKLGMSADCLQKHRNNACSSLRSLVVPRGPSWSLVVPRGPSWSLVVPRGPSWSLVVPRPIGLPVHPLVSKWHRDTVSRWRLSHADRSNRSTSNSVIPASFQRHSSVIRQIAAKCCQDEYD